jgi:ribonuclease HI
MTTQSRENPLSEPTKSHSYQKPDLTRSSLRAADYEFQLYTDGSGWNDRFAGYCAVLRSDKHNKFVCSAASIYGADTERAEFEGLLAGLQSIMDTMDWNNKHQRSLMQMRRTSVYWVTDREHLVGAMLKKADGSYEYKRRTTPDLWARLEWYEKIFDITAVWRERNTIAWQGYADTIASECRTQMKHYVEACRAAAPYPTLV